ncbi:MAG: type II CAAX endopeptidase family protein [Gemmatimonadota bacterium]
MLVACSLAASSLITPLLNRLAFFAGQPIRTDVYAELLSVFAASAIMVQSIDRRSWADLDLSRASFRARPMLGGWLVGAIAIAVVCGTLLVSGLLLLQPSRTESSWLGAAVRVTMVLLPAALAEEMMCRGYLLSVIRECVGVRSAVVLTSVLFGLLHLGNPDATAQSVAVVILSGLLLATVRLAFSSLYAAWMTHFAWNWVMAVPLHAPVSGIRFEAPAYEAVTREPAWLSGGGWGPEGGLVAALGMLGALGYFYARRRRGDSVQDG